jgi:Fe-S cluster assembly protein SufD
MSSTTNFKEAFDILKSNGSDSSIQAIRQDAYDTFNKIGVPGSKHEEWKYTRVNGLFNKEYQLTAESNSSSLTPGELDAFRLPGNEEASELVFINGIYSARLSVIRSEALLLLPLEEAGKNEYKDIVAKYFGDSGKYLKDGINALNTAFAEAAVFLHVRSAKEPVTVYIYHITDAQTGNILAQPRGLFYIEENAQVQIVESYASIGLNESFTNQVLEVIVEKNALLEYYKIQNDAGHTNQVSTTHIRQVGKSYTHTVTISLGGNMVRNNLNLVLDAEYCEAHLYGLYLQKGSSHVDNHTVVDNVKPNCFSNELYKGIMDEHSTAVFNGKIFVQPQAQKTNAYQSNKNILLSNTAAVNAKPQLEIFADDVKCSHGCTVGQLNEEGLFYLQSRGIPENTARSLLLHAFAVDILEHIKPLAIRDYVDKLISERLAFNVT